MERIRKIRLLAQHKIFLVFLSSIGMLFLAGAVNAKPQERSHPSKICINCRKEYSSTCGLCPWCSAQRGPNRPESNNGVNIVKVYPYELETPLGMLVGACKAKYTKLGSRKLKSNHIFVAVFITASKEYPAKSILDWILIDQDGHKHRSIAVISDEVGGILFGVEGLAAYGSPMSPKTTRLIYEIPMNFRYLELHINGQGYVRFWPKKAKEDS